MGKRIIMSENMNYIQNRKYCPVCTIIIVILNILAFAILEFMGDTEDVGFMVKYGAMYTPYLLERGEVYRLFSCIFLHFGIAHLLNNMICLVSFGYVIEKNLGLIRFLIIYIVAGIGGNLLSMYMELVSGSYSVSAGASGAIMGLAGALFLCVIVNKGRFGDFSLRSMLIFIALTIYSGYVNSDVDDMAHLGGLIIGFVVAGIVYGIPKLFKNSIKGQ